MQVLLWILSRLLLALGILLGVLLGLLLLLLLLPHRVEARGDGTAMRVRLWLWCLLPITVLRHPKPPPKQAKKPKKEKAKPAQKTKEPAPPTKKKRPMTAWEVLELVDELLPQLASACGKLLCRITLTRCRFQVVVAEGDDPEATGRKTATVEGFLYGLYATASHYLTVREFAPMVYPCFCSEESSIDIGYYTVAVRAIPIRLLTPGLGLFIKVIRTL